MNPALARILPFGIYIGFLALEAFLPDTTLARSLDLRWLYAVKIALVSVALVMLWRHYVELKAAPPTSAAMWLISAAVGIVVFVLWINLDQPWAMLSQPSGFDPRNAAGAIDWPLAVVRIAGAALVVPVMEELFWRSLVMRWIKKPAFLDVDPRQVGALAFVLSSALFASEHHQWFAGLLAGLAYGALYMRTGNLWTAVLAHALTNLLLGLWVLYTGAWQFW